MKSADRNIYKIVFLAGIFAVLVYFHRNSGKLDKVPYLDNTGHEKIKIVDTRVFETDLKLDTKHYKGRRLKWVSGASHHPSWRNETTLVSGSGSGNSDAEVRGFPKEKKKNNDNKNDFAVLFRSHDITAVQMVTIRIIDDNHEFQLH